MKNSDCKLQALPCAGMREKGLTLVEIMVALVLSLVLLAGVVQIFLSSKSSYRVQEGLGRVQENGRAAAEILGRDARMAGYQGCTNLETIRPTIIVDFSKLAAGVEVDFNIDDFINGYEASGGNWTPTMTGRIASMGVLPGTDVLTIRHGGDCGAYLVGNMTADNANIQIDRTNTCDFEAGDVLFITDCRSADIFTATNVSVSTGGGGETETIAHAENLNIDNRLSKAYLEDSQVMKFESVSYFIRLGAGGQPSLWRLFNGRPSGGDNPQELVEGVENMQVLYGVDRSNDYAADCYVSADGFPTTTPPSSNCTNSNRWRDVVSVRLSLLLRTPEDHLSPKPVQYTYDGATVSDPGDHRLRRVFTTTVNLRNRVP